MKLKAGVLILALLLAFTIVSAQNQTIEEKAVSCLKNKLGSNCGGSGSIEQLAFSLLAMASDSSIQTTCQNALEDKQENDNSWNQNIKETSLAIIALSNIGKNTKNAADWLLNKKRIPKDIEWYLEIDSNDETSCTLTYDKTSRTIKIGEDKIISGNPGACFSLAYDDYFLEISDSCLQKNFTISCNKAFMSTLLYKEPDSAVWHVSSDVQSASANGETRHELNFYCLGSPSCKYEDNLWAALALQRTGYKIDGLLPYITALADENEEFFPASFLYLFTNSEDYLQEITTLQTSDGYWDLKKQGRYYDTALALLAVSGSGAENLAKDWLFEVQGKDGCWNNGNIRDTSFILWAAYPKAPIITEPKLPDCEPIYYCVSLGECTEAKGNDLSDSYYCPGLKICCDRAAIKKTCTDMGGKECERGYVCDEATVTALDTNKCCLGTCELETLAKSECERQGYVCRTECLDNEKEVEYTCSLRDVCCKEKSRLWLVWLLAILIVIVILAIIFRNKLRTLIFKFRTGFRKAPVTMTRPGFPPLPPGAPAGLRKMFPSRVFPRPAVRKPITRAGKGTGVDKELEETLKKLKEISE